MMIDNMTDKLCWIQAVHQATIPAAAPQQMFGEEHPHNDFLAKLRAYLDLATQSYLIV